jgi:hypothetical protein
MQATLGDLTTFQALAERTGINERTVRYWSAVDLAGFRTHCTVRVGGRRLVNMPKTAEWLERVGRDDAAEVQGA